MIGFSDGNGHPFSFSAILNGYRPDRFAACGWPVIAAYLARRDPSDFGIGDLRVTHAWMPDPEMTRGLCDACGIDVAARDVRELEGQVDAVIIARDDADSHWALAEPFLARGTPVFVDKPLAPSADVLDRFAPYLEAGMLMSCSGMRYAAELDGPRSELAEYGSLRLVRGAVVLDWMRYGIHAIDAICGVVRPRAVAVTPPPGQPPVRRHRDPRRAADPDRRARSRPEAVPVRLHRQRARHLARRDRQLHHVPAPPRALRGDGADRCSAHPARGGARAASHPARRPGGAGDRPTRGARLTWTIERCTT
jgi:hypothetical protein